MLKIFKLIASHNLVKLPETGTKMVKITKVGSCNKKICIRNRNQRYNFGYRPDMSDIRLDVTAGHSPIFQRNPAQTGHQAGNQSRALSLSQGNGNQGGNWGIENCPDRDAFVAMHIA
ncbi:hypothetical protein MAR_015449 [Mya arenaria]|uniref:Uncharacterized protein n=1 Tax=Mya arenaria TaxID=6604 RepID=A0ABY7FH25_MYAAR|nr:uncharacterized protein LOC128211811 [Mya arenaria]WAR21475.1 hypothetical protein MAR_015449 [Mya arenaria]